MSLLLAAFISVRIGRLPGRIQEVTLNGDRTVQTALETANLDADGFEIRVNGQPATADTTLNHGDIILLVKKIKGNCQDGSCNNEINEFTIVKIGRVPGPSLTEVALEGRQVNVQDVLDVAKLSFDKKRDAIFVNDSQVESTATRVNDGDVIILKKAPPKPVALGSSAAPSPEPETPGSLRAKAQQLRQEASELEGQALALEIPAARAAFRAARQKLVDLGVDPDDEYDDEDDE